MDGPGFAGQAGNSAPLMRAASSATKRKWGEGHDQGRDHKGRDHKILARLRTCET